MKTRKKKPQHKTHKAPTPAPKPVPIAVPKPEPLPDLSQLYPTYAVDIEKECAKQSRGEDELVGRICTLSNEDVLNGYVNFEDIAKVTRMLLFAKISKDDVTAIRAGIETYEKFHLRGVRNKLEIASRLKPEGALTDGEMAPEVVQRYADMVFPTSDFARRRSMVIFPDRVWNHPVINKLIHAETRFNIVVAGGRSWKTMLAIMFTIACAIRRPKTSYYMAAPTRAQAKLIFWDRLTEFTPKEVIHSVRDGDLILHLKNGSEIHLVSLDVPARFEGKSTWNGAVIDEAGDAAYNVFDQHVRATLADSKGWCWVIGRARQTKSPYFKELKLRAQSGQEGYQFFSWKSADILDPDEIAAIKSEVAPIVYAQEFDAEFQDALGRAYAYYDADVHKREIPFNIEHALVACCDFNVNPCVWEIGQELPGRFFNILDEVSDANTDTFKMCVLTKARLTALFGGDENRAKLQHLDWYGDYAGTQRTTNATFSNWKIIKESFADWNTQFHLRPSPHIIDRINAVNGRMRSADGGVHFACSEKATLLRKDFENLSVPDVMKEHETEQTLTHASDAFGYWVEAVVGGMAGTVGMQPGTYTT
jgi:hypothetical protein